MRKKRRYDAYDDERCNAERGPSMFRTANDWEDLLFRCYLLRQGYLSEEDVVKLDKAESTIRFYIELHEMGVEA